MEVYINQTTDCHVMEFSVSPNGRYEDYWLYNKAKDFEGKLFECSIRNGVVTFSLKKEGE